MEKKLARFRPLLIPFLILAITTLIIWAPFALNDQMTRIFANYDGPNYLVIAKCGYDPDCIRTTFSQPLPLEYYPAHFPGYPLFIKIFDLFLPGWWAMLVVNFLATASLITIFYLLLKSLKVRGAVWLATLILFLPARIVILRSVGAPETLFLTALLASIYFFRKEKYFASGLFLAAAQITKTPAIILFGAYLITIFLKDIWGEKKIKVKKLIKYWPLTLGPLTIIPVFLIFQYQAGDFLAYFHSGDNFHIVFPPFQTFISSRSWLGDFWLEDIIYLYFLGGITATFLWKKYKADIITIFPALFYLATLFVAHRDLARYSSPLYPFYILALAPFLKKKEFKIVFFLLLPAIYLYTINFINYNLAPIADWAPYF
ncbi:hypothetical protein ISS42_02850 [Candidatus Shapirobacteria bacterium]|nr:hypothetical protein [Candidatus Shapirobacteria bacterium]